MANSTETQGWTSSPDTRGTWDILLTCLITTFLCIWTSVYPNIGAPTDGYWVRVRDKFSLACLGLLGPDFLIVLATGQWSSARRSFNKFKAEGHDNWTITHSFFADMGGFVLDARGLEHPIPVDGEQLFYLVKNNYVECPTVTKEELDDRNKSDGLARLITVIQATWFVIDLIARAIHHLTVTTIELTTVSFVVILFGTSWCWKDKPSDVQTTITIKSDTDINVIVASNPHNSESVEGYYHTPLDFISRHETATNVIWQYFNDLLRKIIGFSPFIRRVYKKPWDRIPGDMFLLMDFDLQLVAAGFIAVFSAIFVIAWNSHFPTLFEQMAWRAASLYMMLYGVIGCLWMGMWVWVFFPRIRYAEGPALSLFERGLHIEFPGLHRTLYREPCLPRIEPTRHKHQKQTRSLLRILDEAGRVLTKTYNISPDKDPHLNIPAGFMIGNTVLCLLYLVFRAYILIEDLVGLRSLPSDAYKTVEWLSFLPHV